MKVILIQNVENLGKIGEEKEVKPGYGRNFLLRQGLAVLPGDSRAREIKLKNEESGKNKAAKDIAMEELAEKINGQEYVFAVKTDEKGKLYGSLGPKEIAEKLGITEKLVTKNFKEIGTFDLEISFSPKLKSKVKIVLKKEK